MESTSSLKALDVARICFEQGAGPKRCTDCAMLVAVAQSGPYDDLTAWRRMAGTFAAHRSHLNLKTARASLSRLVGDGWLESLPGGGRGASYRFTAKLAQSLPHPFLGTQRTQFRAPCAPNIGCSGESTSAPNIGHPAYPDLGAQHTQKRVTVQSSSESFRKERDSPPTPQPAFASQERADLDTFIIQVSPKLSGLELPQRVRKQVDELVTAYGIPAVRAAVAKADESTQHIQNPLAYAATVLRNQARIPTPTNGKRRRIDCETDLDVWAQDAKDLAKK